MYQLNFQDTRIICFMEKERPRRHCPKSDRSYRHIEMNERKNNLIGNENVLHRLIISSDTDDHSLGKYPPNHSRSLSSSLVSHSSVRCPNSQHACTLTTLLHLIFFLGFLQRWEKSRDREIELIIKSHGGGGQSSLIHCHRCKLPPLSYIIISGGRLRKLGCSLRFIFPKVQVPRGCPVHSYPQFLLLHWRSIERDTTESKETAFPQSHGSSPPFSSPSSPVIKSKHVTRAPPPYSESWANQRFSLGKLEAERDKEGRAATASGAELGVESSMKD